jgi:hypothetical protein
MEKQHTYDIIQVHRAQRQKKHTPCTLEVYINLSSSLLRAELLKIWARMKINKSTECTIDHTYGFIIQYCFKLHTMNSIVV